jgi:nucleotide-binding universal stress UspA family protein
MRSSIVVGVDGSRAATRAASVAASLARRLDYRLVLAHVAGDPPVFPYGAPRARELQRRRALEQATLVVAGAVVVGVDAGAEGRAQDPSLRPLKQRAPAERWPRCRAPMMRWWRY